jgi:predicted Fe-Mo cluster-binding NifX family protein
MKLIFPTDENAGYLSDRGAHFGKAKFYTMITLQDGVITEVECVVNPGHSGGACGNAVANIMALKPDALIVSGIGGSPAQGFAKAGLALYVDQDSATVQESVKRFVEGSLRQLGSSGTCSAH